MGAFVGGIGLLYNVWKNQPTLDRGISVWVLKYGTICLVQNKLHITLWIALQNSDIKTFYWKVLSVQLKRQLVQRTKERNVANRECKEKRVACTSTRTHISSSTLLSVTSFFLDTSYSDVPLAVHQTLTVFSHRLLQQLAMCCVQSHL